MPATSSPPPFTAPDVHCNCEVSSQAGNCFYFRLGSESLTLSTRTDLHTHTRSTNISPHYCPWCLLGSDRLGQITGEIDIDAVHDGQVWTLAHRHIIGVS